MSIHQKFDFEQLKSSLHIESLVMEWLPGGKRKGNEWVALNPMRADSKPGSFSVNLNTGIWSDFATGKGGDIIELYCYLNQAGKTQAYLDLNKSCSLVPSKTRLVDVKDDKGELIYPAPDNCGVPSVKNDGMWCYKDEEGRVLHYVVRFNGKDGEKTTPPYTYRQKNGVCSWQCKGTGRLKNTLYGLELLAGTDKNILLVEGEKTAESARKLLPDYLVMCWPFGCKSVNKVDFSPLNGRVVYLWPDNDQNGFDAMQTAKELLRGIAEKVILIDIKPFKECKPGWDLADAEPEDMPLILECFQPKLERESFPDLSTKFNVLNTTDNVNHLLQHYNIEVKYNLMTNYPEFKISGKKFSAINEADCCFVEMCNLCVKNRVPYSTLANHLLVISDRNRYHPAIQFIESRPWDGIDRLTDFIATVTADNQDLANKLIYRWMIGCVAAAYSEDGISLEGMLIFQGAQRIGKTYWFIKLVPPEWRHLIQEGVALNPDNKDLVIEGTSIWLGELGEINGVIRKSDIESLKNFITRSKDVYRVPFGKSARKAPRRSSFFGSVNNQAFLADETGNRRYWTVAVNKIDYNHTIDMQQVWAQVKVVFDAGETHRLTEDEQRLINIENELFKHVDPLEESILSRFDWSDSYRGNPMTCLDVLLKLGLDLSSSQIDKMARKCGPILARITGKKGRRSNGKTVYDMPNYIMSNIRQCT